MNVEEVEDMNVEEVEDMNVGYIYAKESNVENNLESILHLDETFDNVNEEPNVQVLNGDNDTHVHNDSAFGNEDISVNDVIKGLDDVQNPQSKCFFKITRGKRAGKECGAQSLKDKNYCYRHISRSKTPISVPTPL